MRDLATAFDLFLTAHGVLPQRTQQLWYEVVTAHNARGRHYHTLLHLEDLHTKLTALHNTLQDPGAVLLAIVYHDFVYSTMSKDNESRSATVLRDRMRTCNMPVALVERAAQHILATAQHGPSSDPDTDLFTDADLSILGATPERYRLYAQQVRREYRRFPDLLYNPGRRKVLAHFLAMPQLFKTPYFRERYEEQARVNLKAELAGTI